VAHPLKAFFKIERHVNPGGFCRAQTHGVKPELLFVIFTD
jgi:hypothetical protein